MSNSEARTFKFETEEQASRACDAVISKFHITARLMTKNPKKVALTIPEPLISDVCEFMKSLGGKSSAFWFSFLGR